MFWNCWSIAWKASSGTITWELLSEFCHCYPAFQLEDELYFQEGEE
jgi:hypothetical protein